MSILWAVIIGFIAGAVAKLLMPGKDPGGFIITTMLGIIGAVLATWLGQAMGYYRPDESTGMIGAVIGAVLLLMIYRLFRRRSTV